MDEINLRQKRKYKFKIIYSFQTHIAHDIKIVMASFEKLEWKGLQYNLEMGTEGGNENAQ